MNGIINVLKPSGMSSHDVVGQVRRIYQLKKVGHSGTLDPLAAGVLPVYLGQATRLIEYGDSDVKTYRGEFAFGFSTDTEDSTGVVVAESGLPQVTVAELEAVVASFAGLVEQRPSRYSAISINGVKAYKLARQCADFAMPVRTVEIHAAQLLAYDAAQGRGLLEITCSKGTYIRSLIRDLGERLGCCACMTYLVRLEAGLFTIAEAATLEELRATPEQYILPPDTAIQGLPAAALNERQCGELLQGKAVPFAGPCLSAGSVVRVYGPDDRLVGIARFDQEHHVLRPHKMFAQMG